MFQRVSDSDRRVCPVLSAKIKSALCYPIPERIRNGGFELAHSYVELAGELQAYLQGRRPRVLAAEALRRFEGMQS